jgi:hypothetical protein
MSLFQSVAARPVSDQDQCIDLILQLGSAMRVVVDHNDILALGG